MHKADVTVRGIEAIKLYMPPTKAKLDMNAAEERGHTVKETTPQITRPPAITSVERYRQELCQLLSDLDNNQESRLRTLAFNGELKMSKFRSLYWALLLRVLSSDYRSWPQQRERQRKRYEKLRQEFMKNPHEMNIPDDNPLSQATQSVWNQYFSDQELFSVIRQDVVRTFPGVDFFRKDIIQTAMSNILFYYAREHPYMSYRQGMHEVLAPILFVVYSDHQSLLHFREIAELQDFDATLLDVLCPDYLEADSYSIFSRLMSSIESYYRISNNITDRYTTLHDYDVSSASTEVEVISQLNLIRDKILAKEDLHLHNYLLKLDIPLHLFGIRWLRLLFGREFPLLDLLVLWDAVFADSDRFDLPNYILVAMLIRIRDKLLLSDYTTCLTYLMRYPVNVDISLILRHALHMQMPKNFERPENAFVYFTPTTVVNNKEKAAAPVSTTTATQKGKPLETPQSMHQMEHQITLLQKRNAADSAALARLNVQPETTRTAMDGYVETSPELMRLELKNAQAILAMSRNKLQTYMGVVRRHMSKQPQPLPDELLQSLDGIDELCAILDVKFMFPLNSRNRAPIDQAFEADEQQQKATAGVMLGTRQTAVLSNEKTANKYINSSRSWETRSHLETTYEKPDLNTTRSLGNVKEIELITIASDERVVVTTNGLPVASTIENSLYTSNLPREDPLKLHLK